MKNKEKEKLIIFSKKNKQSLELTEPHTISYAANQELSRRSIVWSVWSIEG